MQQALTSPVSSRGNSSAPSTEEAPLAAAVAGEPSSASTAAMDAFRNGRPLSRLCVKGPVQNSNKYV